MAKKPKHAISPTREEDYAQWYLQVIRAADLAESSPVRGCIVIKPRGYAIWENMQRVLDRMFKETGHENAYFPLLIPKRFLEKEAEHVDGFAKECAVVTHHRLEQGPDGKLVPAGPLDEPLIVRPTSETIIGVMFAKWIQSYRDLPLLINQWANVVRWEMRTRTFLRTSEFLWQEGHTAHATEQEAWDETRLMLDVYAKFAEEFMAMPVIKGEKTDGERFPGAVSTLSIEAMMQDRKALQSGTSHFLGQNFARAQEIKFQDKDAEERFAWTTSWGVSTRLIGAMLMTHSDDDGLVLPPRMAPQHVAILPIYRDDQQRSAVLEYCEQLKRQLVDIDFSDGKVNAVVDDRDLRGGENNWQNIKWGVPIRLEIGPKDLAKNAVFMGRRDTGEKISIGRESFVTNVSAMLDEMQQTMFQRSLDFRKSHTRTIDDLETFREFFTPENSEKPEIHGGFALCHWSESPEMNQVLERLKVTVRCVPFEQDEEDGVCIFTGKPSRRRALFAKAY